MVVITLQKAKYTGCNYCVQLAPGQFQMSRKDGKSVLLHSKEKNVFTIKSLDENIYYDSKKAQDACPVKIIDVKQV
ncbi:hypothetical protein KH5_09690 [Urechidicola sp. KH5]